ncbi:hypothetical protein [Arthrobacter sp. efr-133-TYG-120]|uniref:hypothetical protein n=1 Tax=Arthrobacter sp. efr-133-TYG-120 TaxID=3040280 RepID=UPI00254A6682|nr:hypothetical protein [Arthrobacter sp. efr-133-TYG-120]
MHRRIILNMVGRIAGAVKSFWQQQKRIIAGVFLVLTLIPIVVSGIRFCMHQDVLKNCKNYRSTCQDPAIRKVLSSRADPSDVARAAHDVYVPLIQKLERSDVANGPEMAATLSGVYIELDREISSNSLASACVRDNLGELMIDDGLNTSFAGFVASLMDGVGEIAGKAPLVGQLPKATLHAGAQLLGVGMFLESTYNKFHDFPAYSELNCRVGSGAL